MAARGCGASRTAGGIYAVVPVGDEGHPIECFMFDMPKVIDVAALGITSVGVHPVEQPDGSVWLFDIVGSEHYPNVADFVEETRRLGISRRLPRSLPWERLDKRSRLVLLHKRAIVGGTEEYRAYFNASPPKLAVGVRACPSLVSRLHCGRGGEPHEGVDPCNRVWYEDVDGGESYLVMPTDNHRTVLRRIAETPYIGYSRPDGASPSYQLAAFLRFPLATIEVVRDDEGGSHRIIERVEMARVPTRVVDE